MVPNKISSIFITACVSLSVQGCANLANYTSVYRTTQLESSNTRGIVLDAEQYMVLSRDGSTCVMPSPDGLASVSGGGGLLAELVDGPSGNAGASGIFGISEAALNIGLRTQSIQLLRDSLFATCLAAQNESIDEHETGMLLRRFQSQLTAILAIEQLTGAVVSGGGSTVSVAGATPGDFVLGIANASGRATEEIARNETRILEIEQTYLPQVDSRLNSANLSDAEQAALISDQARFREERDRLRARNTNLAAVENAMANALEDIDQGGALAASAAFGGGIQFAAPHGAGNTPSIEHVATAVAEIVESARTTDDTGYLCFSWLRRIVGDGVAFQGNTTDGFDAAEAAEALRTFCEARTGVADSVWIERLRSDYGDAVDAAISALYDDTPERYNESMGLIEQITQQLNAASEIEDRATHNEN